MVLEDLLVDERHLDVDLRELRLAIEAQILVAEAAHDLEVALVARDHQQLLEDLRRLGERVELARVEPRRHEEVPRAARRVLHHERRLDLEEAVLAEVVARHARDLRARDQVLLQLGAAQIEVAILEAQRIVGVDVVLDRERRRLGLREHLDALDPDLDRAGRHLVVDLGAARADLAGDADAPLRAQLARCIVRRLVERLVEHELREALAVAQIDEHAAAVVAVGLDPTGQDDVLSGVPGAQGATAVGSRMRGQERAHEAGTLARFNAVLGAIRAPSPKGGNTSSCDRIRSLGCGEFDPSRTAALAFSSSAAAGSKDQPDRGHRAAARRCASSRAYADI